MINHLIPTGPLTHWGTVLKILDGAINSMKPREACMPKDWALFSSVDGLLPVQHQAII